MSRWPQSIQGQVAVRLTLVFLLGTGVGVAALLFEGTQGASAGTGEDLAHDLLREFIFDIAWIIPLFVAGTLAVGIWSIRIALKPLRAVSARAAAIAPDATAVRLPTEGLPSELVPLVAAVNHALDRLEQGFATQRQFTANAAHELRTPLAILTAGLEALDQSPEVVALRSDANRMNRLIAQLLAVARMDALPEEANGVVDLTAIAAAEVAYLAPWAIERGVSIGFDGPGTDVSVHGNANAITDALRNLVENAVSFAPQGTEVVVAVSADGKLIVSDSGPGVSPGDHVWVFERFRRGPGHARGGAGLGLAIVAEVARSHGGSVVVQEAPGGGARFILSFRLAPQSAAAASPA